MKYGLIMKCIKLSFLCAWIMLLYFSCEKRIEKEEVFSEDKEVPVFKALKTKENIIIDGKMDEDIWNKTDSTRFKYFYKVEKSTDKQKSIFRALWDENSLYFFYDFKDEYLTVRETKRDGEPYLDDCGEIFIIPVPEPLDTHFCFEINLNKAANDLIYFNDYYKGNEIGFKSFNPEYKVEVSYNGTINDNSDIDKGWTMELEIPISLFGFLADFEPVKAGNKWMFLAIRQERNEVEGERRIISTIFPIKNTFKNVHQPKDFGFLEFVE